jgi:hypothetical protein
MIISSPETELFNASCIDCPCWTIISAAVPIPEPDKRTSKAKNRVINLFIYIPHVRLFINYYLLFGFIFHKLK